MSESDPDVENITAELNESSLNDSFIDQSEDTPKVYKLLKGQKDSIIVLWSQSGHGFRGFIRDRSKKPHIWNIVCYKTGYTDKNYS